MNGEAFAQNSNCKIGVNFKVDFSSSHISQIRHIIKNQIRLN